MANQNKTDPAGHKPSILMSQCQYFNSSLIKMGLKDKISKDDYMEKMIILPALQTLCG